MKKVLLFLLFFLIIFALLVVRYAYATSDPTYPDEVIQTTLYSEVLQEEREVIIHLPATYDPHKKYPVMYVLDGSSQDKHMAHTLKVLSGAGYVPETIIVGLPNVSGTGRQRDYTPPFMRMDIDKADSPMGRGDAFLTFMEQELFPYMEDTYAVSTSRSIAGNSRGGLLVMYSLIYKPKLFQGRFALSPALWRDDNAIIKKVAEHLDSDTLPSFLYMSLGADEVDKMKDAFKEMTHTLAEKGPESLTWHATLTSKATHQTNAERSAPMAIRKWTEYLMAATPPAAPN